MRLRNGPDRDGMRRRRRPTGTSPSRRGLPFSKRPGRSRRPHRAAPPRTRLHQVGTGRCCPYPSAPGGLTPEPLAGPAEAGRSVAPAPGAQGPSGHGGASGASYGIMPGSGDAHTDHSSGPTAAPGYGRVAPPGGVPAGAVPPAPAAVPASSGQYGLMPAQATATKPAQPTTSPVQPARPAPVATTQAPPAASVSPSTDRPAASSLNLDGAPVRLEW